MSTSGLEWQRFRGRCVISPDISGGPCPLYRTSVSSAVPGLWDIRGALKMLNFWGLSAGPECSPLKWTNFIGVFCIAFQRAANDSIFSGYNNVYDGLQDSFFETATKRESIPLVLRGQRSANTPLQQTFGVT